MSHFVTSYLYELTSISYSGEYDIDFSVSVDVLFVLYVGNGEFLVLGMA